MKHTVIFNKEADKLLGKQLPIIKEEVKTYAIDLSNRSLPKEFDSLQIYLPRIKSLYQSLIEEVHKTISAKRTLNDINNLDAHYEKEEKALSESKENLQEDLRVLKKQEQGYNNILGHVVRNWRIALLFLLLLSGAESIINYKALLSISSNNLTALIGAIGISIALFIICHIFKDVLNFFESRAVKWAVGIGIVSLVTALLYSFAQLRLSFNAQLEGTTTEHISEFNFVILNLSMVLSGIALVLIYKPSKKQMDDYHQHQIIAKQLRAKEKEHKKVEIDLLSLEKKKSDQLEKIEGVLLMAHHYEQSISAEYEKGFSIFCSENIIHRKDKVTPACFVEKPEALSLYFNHIEFQHNQN